MGPLMRGHDWAATPVGPPQGWPQTLKTTVRLMLTSRHPMFIWWGEALTRQPAHRNRRPETASASQPRRRRTPSSAGYSSCIRARHGVGHGVDTELAG